MVMELVHFDMFSVDNVRWMTFKPQTHRTKNNIVTLEFKSYVCKLKKKLHLK